VRGLAVGVGIDELEGASIETADDLLGALARLADGGIDVVFLSLDLPDGQGADVVRAVLERAPDVAVIAIAEASETERAMGSGAADVLPPEAGMELLSRAARYAVALRRMREELERRREVDETTGLSNARGFARFAEHHLALAARSKQSLVLVFVRIDGFVELDEAAPARAAWLAETAEVLRAAVRESDVVAHLGSGAFCVLLTGDAAGAESLVLSRAVEAVASSNARAGRTDGLSLSFGAATYDPARPVTVEELIAEADPAGRAGVA
jgi:diguanylate cyclase (GGDEF)-like protein